MTRLKEENRLLLIMGIPKQASIAESSGIWFCVFQTQELRDLHSRMEYFQEDNCIVFAEWKKQKKEVEDLALMTIYSVILCFYASIIYFVIFLKPDCAFLDNIDC